MSYFILYICVAIWIFMDSKKRKFNGTLYAVATCILGPLVAPVYLAKRNLKDGEVREGGTGWNVLKYFALFWTITMVIVGVSGMIGISNVAHQASSDGEKAGVAIGAALGIGMLLVLWFIPMVCALVLGLFLKKASIVEKGPTGELAKTTEG